MNGRILLLVILAFIPLLLVGCSTSGEKETEDIDSDFPPSMTGQIIINNVEYKIQYGAFKWERKKGLNTEIVQTDHASPNQMAAHIEPISVSANQEIYIKIEDDPDLNVYLWNENAMEKEIKLETDHIIVPSSKGKYIFEVLAKWANGTVSYTFVVEVQ